MGGMRKQLCKLCYVYVVAEIVYKIHSEVPGSKDSERM